MQSLKPAIGVIQTLVPVLYCGGLIYYFVDHSGSLQNAMTSGLGSTLLGLGAIGLIFAVVLLVKLTIIFAAWRSSRPVGRGDPDASAKGDGFEADAVIARYMAQRTSDATPGSAARPPERGGPAKGPTFGRKIR